MRRTLARAATGVKDFLGRQVFRYEQRQAWPLQLKYDNEPAENAPDEDVTTDPDLPRQQMTGFVL